MVPCAISVRPQVSSIDFQTITYIDGVHNPRETVPDRHLLVFGIRLLSKECMVGIPLGNGGADHGLDSNVGRTDQLPSALANLDAASSTVPSHSG